MYQFYITFILKAIYDPTFYVLAIIVFIVIIGFTLGLAVGARGVQNRHFLYIDTAVADTLAFNAI